MIELRHRRNGQPCSIPNAWEELTPELFEGIMIDVQRFARGELSPARVRLHHICRVMRWNPDTLPYRADEDTKATLVWLAEQVDFIFRIAYPDNDAALRGLTEAERALAKKTPPERLSLPIARYLARQPYAFVLNGCFCAQLIPFVSIQGKMYSGYEIDTGYGRLTCSLTALQFIEARALLGAGPEALPLLAAILYCPAPYASDTAHLLARSFERLPQHILEGIAFNFASLVSYLFSRTDFSLLAQGEDEAPKLITTGSLEALYNLSADGYGSVTQVEQMNVIKYLTILRKKLIDAVHSMHAAEMSLADISQHCGLPVSLLKKMI